MTPVASKILIVDHKEEISAVLCEYMEHEGLTPVVAHTGEAALEKIRSEHPDALIVNLKPPDMDGMQIMKGTKALVERVLRDKAHREEAARLQEQIHRAKKEWELTFDVVPDPIFFVDDQCRIQRANRAAAALLGLEPSQLIDKYCYETPLDGAEPLPSSPFRRMRMTGKEERCDIKVAGLGKVFDATASPLFDSSGHGQRDRASWHFGGRHPISSEALHAGFAGPQSSRGAGCATPSSVGGSPPGILRGS